jgi:glycogen phosphorylase
MTLAPGRFAIGPYLNRTRIAYFSMEIAIRPEMHTYSGGLGVLAGDTARSCADLELPVVFVTLVSREGYLRQEIDDQGRQVEHSDAWQPADYATALRAKVAVPIGEREVWVRPWLYELEAPLGYSIPILMLDTDLDENHPEDRRITDKLYGGGDEYRLKQEIVLGIGGLRLLTALGFSCRVFHLNEGHAALLALDLLRRFPRPADQVAENGIKYDVGRVREMCIFTTHTPVEAGHDRFSYQLVEQMLGHYFEMDQLRKLAGRDEMNMTRLALQLTDYVNGVARRHAETTQKMFPGHRIRFVTNGIHLPTWVHPAFRSLYDRAHPSWGNEPELLVHADQLANAQVWTAKQEAKRDLIELVRQRTGVQMSPDVPTIGFARRMTSYKRPELLFSDIDRLLRIAEKHPFQVVLSGKAHWRDEQGKGHIQAISNRISELRDRIKMTFLPGYDMGVAKTIVAGVDIWLNNPVPPMEASGTSGMKAALNGGLNLSVLDGWWVEACIDGVTGWSIGVDSDGGPASTSAEDLYAKLEQTVLPLYYADRERWIWMMKEAISKIPSYFNTQRMMRRYAAEAYLR